MNSFRDFAKKNCGITPFSFSTAEMKDVELLVPLYQRLFVWEEEQINQLFEDLWTAYCADKTQPYYIGTLTVYQNSEDQNIWELVDGQQRMTVLTLLGIACLHNSHKWGDNSSWKCFFEKGNNMGSRLRYFARNKDQEDLSTLIKELNVDKITNANMKRFIEVFHRFEQRYDLSSGFSNFVYTKATALVAFLPDSYKLNDLNLYFEKMNAGGKQLEAHEILKGRYFGRFSLLWNAIADGSKQFHSIKENTNTIGELTLENLLKNGDSISDKDKSEPSKVDLIYDSTRLVMSFPVFLLHALSICIESNEDGFNEFWNPKKLLATFQKAEKAWNEKKNLDETTKSFDEAFVEVMEYYRKWIDEWIIHIEDDRPASPYQEMESGNKEDWTFKEKIRQFQAMLYVSSDERQKWVLEAYQTTKTLKLNKNRFFCLLKQQDNNRHNLFNARKDCFIEDDIDHSEFSYGHIDRYWFWKLDYILWEKVFNKEPVDNLNEDQLDAVKAYTFRRNRSIEHLHPQISDNPWEKKELDSFGNLAMISASFNSQQGNDTVGTKFGRMGDKLAKKDLESIKLLLMFNAANGKDNQWTPYTADAHRKEMIQVLKGYYNSNLIVGNT